MWNLETITANWELCKHDVIQQHFKESAFVHAKDDSDTGYCVVPRHLPGIRPEDILAPAPTIEEVANAMRSLI